MKEKYKLDDDYCYIYNIQIMGIKEIFVSSNDLSVHYIQRLLRLSCHVYNVYENCI